MKGSSIRVTKRDKARHKILTGSGAGPGRAAPRHAERRFVKARGGGRRESRAEGGREVDAHSTLSGRNALGPPRRAAPRPASAEAGRRRRGGGHRVGCVKLRLQQPRLTERRGGFSAAGVAPASGGGEREINPTTAQCVAYYRWSRRNAAMQKTRGSATGTPGVGVGRLGWVASARPALPSLRAP